MLDESSVDARCSYRKMFNVHASCFRYHGVSWFRVAGKCYADNCSSTCVIRAEDMSIHSCHNEIEQNGREGKGIRRVLPSADPRVFLRCRTRTRRVESERRSDAEVNIGTWEYIYMYVDALAHNRFLQNRC